MSYLLLASQRCEIRFLITTFLHSQVKLLEKIKEARRSDALQDYDPQFKPEDDSLELLSEIVKEFRDDELEHLDIAVEQDAQQAPAHALLSAVIGFGCKGAIRIAKRF